MYSLLTFTFCIHLLLVNQNTITPELPINDVVLEKLKSLKEN